MGNSQFIAIENGYHPVIFNSCLVNGGQVVPNHLSLSEDKPVCIITGYVFFRVIFSTST
jgi:DNA mismatch repair ATPase MutS